MRPTSSSRAAMRRLADHVDAYARRVYPAVLDQHAGASICSPLGVWLLLATCASSAPGRTRRELEAALGCPADEAAELVAAFLASPPPALKAGIALWVRPVDATDELAAWARGLPVQVETGFMPSQEEADAWTRRLTDGLIEKLPVGLDRDVRIVLASALATKISWRAPFEVAPADEHLDDESPWRGRVTRLLQDLKPHAALMRTRAAGVVAVHYAQAVEEMTVLSVSAATDVPRAAVLEAAHQVLAAGRGDERAAARCSLFDLPEGRGHSWQIAQDTVRTWRPGALTERITDVVLPAWHADGQLELLRDARFGTAGALEAMRALICAAPDDEMGAVQAATASFDRYGFEAAAVTVFAAVTAAAPGAPPEQGLRRRARLRFDHPYAAVAVAGNPLSWHEDADDFTGVPLFSAWVGDAIEPEGDIQPPKS